MLDRVNEDQMPGRSSDASRRRPAVSGVRREARPFRSVRGAGDLRHELGHDFYRDIRSTMPRLPASCWSRGADLY